MTPQQIASEFQSLVNRVENAEQALKVLGKTEHETCNAFASRIRNDIGFARGNVEMLREKVEALSTAYHKHKAEIAEQRTRADVAEKEVERMRAEAKYDHNKSTLAWKDFDTLKANVDAAFDVLNKAPHETYQQCAERVVSASAAADKEIVHLTRERDDFMARLRNETEERIRTLNQLNAMCAQRAATAEQRDALQKRINRVGEILGQLDHETLEACAQTYRDRYVTKTSLELMTKAWNEAADARDSLRADLDRLRKSITDGMKDLADLIRTPLGCVDTATDDPDLTAGGRGMTIDEVRAAYPEALHDAAPALKLPELRDDVRERADLAEKQYREFAGARAPCPSNECAIRNQCTGHLNCTGERRKSDGGGK